MSYHSNQMSHDNQSCRSMDLLFHKDRFAARDHGGCDITENNGYGVVPQTACAVDYALNLLSHTGPVANWHYVE